MYGIFFEEINHAGDGGLYAELVQNRDMEAGTIPEGWRVEGSYVDRYTTLKKEWEIEVDRIYHLRHGPPPSQGEILGAISNCT